MHSDREERLFFCFFFLTVNTVESNPLCVNNPQQMIDMCVPCFNTVLCGSHRLFPWLWVWYCWMRNTEHVWAAGNLCGSSGSRTDRSQLWIEQTLRHKRLGRIPSVWEHTNYTTLAQLGKLVIGYFFPLYFRVLISLTFTATAAWFSEGFNKNSKALSTRPWFFFFFLLLFDIVFGVFICVLTQQRLKSRQNSANLGLSRRTLYMFPDECTSALPLQSSENQRRIKCVLFTLYCSVILRNNSTSLWVHKFDPSPCCTIVL